MRHDLIEIYPRRHDKVDVEMLPVVEYNGTGSWRILELILKKVLNFRNSLPWRIVEARSLKELKEQVSWKFCNEHVFQ